MEQEKLYVTRNGVELFGEKISQARLDLKKVYQSKEEAIDVGGDGWHDNFAFEELSRQEIMLNQRIVNLRAIERKLTMVNKPTSSKILQIGHVAYIEYEDGTIKEYLVAGYGETDLSTTPPTLNYGAPILIQFMGHHIGQEAEVSIRGHINLLCLVNIKPEKE